MKQKIYLVIAMMSMLCLALPAHASPPTISGPDTICVGNYGSYSVTAQSYLSYQWSVTSGGVITTPVSPYPNATILWGATGLATITVQEIVDSTGAVFATLTQNVYVEPLPTPVITSNVVVGCQTLNDSVLQNSGGSGHTQHILTDSSGCVKVCQGSVVTYTAIGSATDTFGWHIVGGNILAMGSDTCMVLWGAAGPGSVTVYDTSVYGCTGTKSVCIDIIARPDAHFYAIGDTTSDTVTICKNNSVMFVDNSTASTGSPIVSWFWSFGDGTYSSAAGTAPISHEYVTAGIDTVSLVVKNACGCTDTFFMIVVVNPQTGVTIACPGVVCQGASATYSLTPTPPCPLSSFASLWTVNGGTILVNNDSNITVQWNNIDTTGFGYVIFNSTPCTLPCPGITVVKVPVIQTIGHISGPSVDCDHSQYLYSMPQWPTTIFTWTISGTTSAYLQHNDQNNQIVLNTSGAGTVYLTCHYTNTLLGCSGVAHDTITVLPSDLLTGPAQACLNTTSGTYQVGTGLNTNWTLTDPTGTVIDSYTGTAYTTPVLTIIGTYVINVTPGTGALYCPIAPYLVKVVGLPPIPDSLLGPDTTCFGTPATYTAKNPIAGDVFEWAAVTGTCNAAEGNTTAATFTGSSPATIEVWRVTSDALHCHSDTLSKLVYRPYVNINITGLDTVCPSTVHHYDAGYSQGETYSWTLYNPLLGSVQTNGLDTADILFNNTSGIVDVIVEVRKCDSNYFDTLKVYIRPLPTLSIHDSLNPVCQHVATYVTLLPTGITGSISWDWGDTYSTCCTTSTSHAYNTPITSNTNYTIVVTVTNPYGCPGTATASTSVTVLPAPVAYISPAGPYTFCGTFSQTLNATLTSGYEPSHTLDWMSVSGGYLTGCTGAPPTCTSYNATTVGGYYVIAIGNNGCADTSNVVQIDTSCGSSGTPCVLTPTGHDYIDSAVVACGSVHLHGGYSGSPLVAFSWAWSPPSGAIGVSTTHTTLDCSFGTAGLYTFGYTVGLTDGADSCYVTNDTTILVPFIAGMVYSVTCTGSGYNVTLLDHSNYFPGYPPTRYSWYKNGVYQTYTLPPTSTYTMLLGAGAYSLGEWVYYGATDSCFVSDSLYLPALPVAGFTFARDTTCAQQASVQFANTSTPASGLSYLWNFGDLSGNSEENPYKVFTYPTSGANGYNVILMVANQYGCTSSVNKFVPLHKPDLGGITAGGGTFCAGTPVMIYYQPGGGFPHYPEDYYWMQALDTMYMTASPIFYTYVYSSGSYWVTGTNHYGCYVNAPTTTVNIIQVPPAVITGSHYACLNVPYTLNGWVGNDPNVSYKWYKNHVLDGTGSTVTDPASYVTSVPDTFMLVVFINYGGDTCSDTSANFLVTVYPQPAAPTINAHMLDCNTYTLKLAALPPLYGSYNWSNGLSGQTVEVTGGGPYGVWYTDTFGCSSFGSTYIDQDPRQYLWIFPTGCYNWCSNQVPTPYIVGPIIPFVYWDYQYVAGPVVTSSSGYVYPWYPPGPGDFDLVLENHYCTDTSGPMDISIDSNCAGCQCLQETISSYSVRCENPPGCCQYYISMCFRNNCDSVTVKVSTRSGGLTPGGFIIPPGYSCDTLLFTPGGGFTGGWVYLYTSWSVGTNYYNCLDSVYIPLCEPGSRQSNPQQANGIAMLNLVPNPAQNSTRIDYTLDGKETNGAIEVYDMMGRLVNSYSITNNAGSWQLSLADYPAGVYLVSLKENGIVIKQSKLSVTR
jgi:PKD repeat protein